MGRKPKNQPLMDEQDYEIEDLKNGPDADYGDEELEDDEGKDENQDTRKTYKDDGDNSGELGGGV